MVAGHPLPVGPRDMTAALHQLRVLIGVGQRHPARSVPPCPALLCPAPALQQGSPRPGDLPACPLPLLPPPQPLCSSPVRGPAAGVQGAGRGSRSREAQPGHSGVMVLTPNNRTAPSFPSHRPLPCCPPCTVCCPPRPLFPAPSPLRPGQALAPAQGSGLSERPVPPQSCGSCAALWLGCVRAGIPRGRAAEVAHPERRPHRRCAPCLQAGPARAQLAAPPPGSPALRGPCPGSRGAAGGVRWELPSPRCAGCGLCSRPQHPAPSPRPCCGGVIAGG